MLKPNFRLLEEDKGTGAGGGGDAGAGGAAAGTGAAAGAGTGAAAGAGGAGAAGAAGAGKGGAAAGADAGAGTGGAAGSGAGAGGDAAGEWAADWRLKAAGGDEKVAKTFERFASPKALADSYRALNQRLSSGELVSKLAKDAKPEEIAKWRTENGIPDKPEAYAMPEGLVVGDADKAGVGKFLTAMHGANATPAQVQAGIKTYYEIKEDAIATMAEADVAHRDEVADALRAEWGADYRGNINGINAFLEMAPAGIKDKLLSARMADGRAVANDPAFMGWLGQVAREVNPVGTVVPAGGDQMGAIDTELDKIRKVMREDRKAYDKDEKMQARFRELLEAKDKRTAK